MLQLNKNSEYPSINIENGIIISVVSNNVKGYIHQIKLKKCKLKRKKFCFLCRSQTNSLLLILGTYVIIFLIASVILIMSVLKLQILNENVKPNKNFGTDANSYKSRYKFNTINDTFTKTLFKEFTWAYKSSLFNCSSLSEVRNFSYLTSGWTKNVFVFEYNGKQYALKTVNTEGTDIKKCLEKQTNKICFDKASSKLYKEYILSKELPHPNIVKVVAWCVNSNNYSENVAIVSELCSPVELITFLRMSFKQRLKVMLDLSQLMAYLAESPLGSVAINDFQRQQFVMCGDTLKLTDLDDLSIEEPKCSEHKHCFQRKLIDNKLLNKNLPDLIQLKCVSNFCIGYNEKQNVVNTYRHFVNLFLNITVPIALKADINALFHSYTSRWSAKTVLKQIQLLYNKYNEIQKKKLDTV